MWPSPKLSLCDEAVWSGASAVSRAGDFPPRRTPTSFGAGPGPVLGSEKLGNSSQWWGKGAVLGRQEWGLAPEGRGKGVRADQMHRHGVRWQEASWRLVVMEGF